MKMLIVIVLLGTIACVSPLRAIEPAPDSIQNVQGSSPLSPGITFDTVGVSQDRQIILDQKVIIKHMAYWIIILALLVTVLLIYNIKKR
jgi:hypothetical protein